MRGDKEFPVFNTIPASVFTKKKKKKSIVARCSTVVALRGKTASQTRGAERYAGDLGTFKSADS